MRNILVIDDEIELCENIRDILELAGYSVSTANNGREGYNMILEDMPDLILCDINMPQMDGFELLGAINQRLKDSIVPPFLFLTARIESTDIRYGLNLGADDYITKPFKHNELLDIIRLRLAKRDQLIKLQNTNLVQQNDVFYKFNKLALPSEDGLMLVNFSDIIRCQADRAYCRFYLTDNSKILVSKPLKDFEDILLAHHFLRVHKSTIINTNCIVRYIKGQGGSLILSDGSEVDVSARKREDLMKVIRPKE